MGAQTVELRTAVIFAVVYVCSFWSCFPIDQSAEPDGLLVVVNLT